MATTNKAIVSYLPLILSQNIPTALVKYQREDFAAAYAIGNTPWLSAASDQNKITRTREHPLVRTLFLTGGYVLLHHGIMVRVNVIMMLTHLTYINFMNPITLILGQLVRYVF